MKKNVLQCQFIYAAEIGQSEKAMISVTGYDF